MRAITYHGRHDMRVETVPDPRIEAPTDVIIRVTATAICGSDLHMYNGWMMPFMKPGDVMGHEFMGVVEEVGPAVKRIKKGDRIVVPFLIACGTCFFCAKQLYSCCENTNPDPGAAFFVKKDLRPPAALYGYTHLYGGIAGGQAEYVRVLNADANAFVIPEGLSDDQVLFMTDIFPTGYQAALQANVTAGSTVAIWGAGPVGQMAALSSRLLGAEKIFIIDDIGYRLEFAREEYGCIPVNMAEIDDPAAWIIDQTDRRGVDATIDAVGFEAKGNKLETVMRGMMLEASSGAALRQTIAAVRRGGTVSIPGVYVGFIQGFVIGDCFDKGLSFAMGQTHVQRYLDRLYQYIHKGEAHPERLITHRMRLEDAPEGYRIFSRQEDNCRKVVLYPNGVP